MKKIALTAKAKAELIDVEMPAIAAPDQVLVETLYSAVSAGTERANLVEMPNTDHAFKGFKYPYFFGYATSAIVREIGSGVTSVKPGDKVLANWAHHAQFNVVTEDNVCKIDDDRVPLKEAAFMMIAGFSMAAIRKVQLEIGESAMVMGCGILGLFAVQLLRIAGAVPVIAADLDVKRRLLALKRGADVALDPMDADFAKQVKAMTHGRGVKTAIEVTGQAVALRHALDCVAPAGRVALLGCTRVSDAGIDFYQKVHKPGVMLIGAHTVARPKWESSPHYWTLCDDQRALLSLIAGERLDVGNLVSETHSPCEATAVYARLDENVDFPIGVAFDWTQLRE
ncbi:MAG TPA: zinc-binding alcohol dehydrogenase [Clostridia bacterium]|nr:zinc-binding alcohol dehydrogenase [Clostridia bacterium]